MSERSRWRGAGSVARLATRAQWRGLVVVTSLLAFGTAVAIAAVVIGDRTHTAYARYLDDAEVGDLLLNPAILTEDTDAAIRAIPHAARIGVDHFFLTSLDDGHPRIDFELGGEFTTQVRSSPDGRFTEFDRPAVSEGRLPTGSGEAFLGDETAEDLDLEIGDEVPVAFWWAGAGNEPTGDEVEPLGVEHVRVVGTGTLPDEALPDDLYPRRRVLVSPDVVADYDCIPPRPGTRASEAEAFAAIFPRDCAALYAFYSLDLEADDAGVHAATAAFNARADQLNERLPAALDAAGYSYFAVPTTTEDERVRVERSLQPTITASLALGGAAFAATLILVVLATARLSRRQGSAVETFEALGVTRAARALGIAAPGAFAAIVGTLVGAALAVPLVAAGPLGVARAVDPDPGPHFAPGLTALVAVPIGFMTVLATAVLAFRAARSRARSPSARRGRILQRLPLRPTVAQGVATALDRRNGADAPLAIGAAATAIAAVTGSLVFGASLSGLLDHAERYGWPPDAAAVIGYGYGDLDDDAVNASLDSDVDVTAWSILGMTFEVAVADTPVTTIIDFGPESLFDGAVLDGRLPVGPDEIALGRRTADALDLGVGDETDISGPFGERTVSVTGFLALPAYGPYLADRAGLGEGAYLPAAVLGDGSRGPGQDASLVAVRLRDDVRPQRFFDELGSEVSGWDDLTGQPFTYAAPVRPAEIVNVAGMRRSPTLLAALLAGTMAVGLASALMLSVRARRQELAVLRVLGFTGTQVRRSVRWQAVTIAISGLAIGLAVGVVLGRAAWRAFATTLGVLPVPAVPVPSLALVALGALGVALVTAVLPGRQAVHRPPGRVLREQ